MPIHASTEIQFANAPSLFSVSIDLQAIAPETTVDILLEVWATHFANQRGGIKGGIDFARM